MRHSRIFAAVGIVALLMALLALAVSSVGESIETEHHRITVLDEGEAHIDLRVERLAAAEDPTATEPPTSTPVPPAATATATPEPTATDEPAESGNTWHSKGAHDGLGVHEHGDAPPQWVLDFEGGPVIYGGDEGTPRENEDKHEAFKGLYEENMGEHGTDVYIRLHFQANPMGRAGGAAKGRYHSYELWARDSAGGISKVQGWLDFGAHPEDRHLGTDADLQNAAMFMRGGCEQWYSRVGGTGKALGYVTGWMPDISITICGVTEFDFDEEAYATRADLHAGNWPSGGIGQLREVGVPWYAHRGPDELRGMTIWTTQFGEHIPGGPDDPRCDEQQVAFGLTYDIVCLPQTFSPTFESIQFPGDVTIRDEIADTSGLVRPN